MSQKQTILMLAKVIENLLIPQKYKLLSNNSCTDYKSSSLSTIFPTLLAVVNIVWGC